MYLLGKTIFLLFLTWAWSQLWPVTKEQHRLHIGKHNMADSVKMYYDKIWIERFEKAIEVFGDTAVIRNKQRNTISLRKQNTQQPIL